MLPILFVSLIVSLVVGSSCERQRDEPSSRISQLPGSPAARRVTNDDLMALLLSAAPTAPIGKDRDPLQIEVLPPGLTVDDDARPLLWASARSLLPALLRAPVVSRRGGQEAEDGEKGGEKGGEKRARACEARTIYFGHRLLLAVAQRYPNALPDVAPSRAQVEAWSERASCLLDDLLHEAQDNARVAGRTVITAEDIVAAHERHRPRSPALLPVIPGELGAPSRVSFSDLNPQPPPDRDALVEALSASASYEPTRIDAALPERTLLRP